MVYINSVQFARVSDIIAILCCAENAVVLPCAAISAAKVLGEDPAPRTYLRREAFPDHLTLHGNSRCPSLQFVSSLDLLNSSHMVLGYGVRPPFLSAF